MICRNVIFHPWASLLVLCLVLACSTAQVVNLNHLSPQGCPQVVHNFTLAHGMLSMVGTRFTLYGEAPGSSESNPTYDYDGSLSMNIVSVNQQHTYDKTAHCNPINDPTLYSVRLSSCTSCQPNYLDAYGPGWKETTVSLVLSDCSDTTGEFNNLTMIINATTTNQTHSITYTNTMANSTYPTLTYTTPENGVKLGLELRDWSWGASSAPYNFLSSTFELGINSSGKYAYHSTSTEQEYGYTVDFGHVTFGAGLILGFLVDGVAVSGAPAGNNSVFNQTLSFTDFFFGLSFPIQYCPSDGNFSTSISSIYYDPTLTVLFSGLTSPSSNTGIIVGAAVGSIAGLAIILGAFIAAYKLSPTVRNIFNPFSARNHTAPPTTRQSGASSSEQTNLESSWRKPTKPAPL